MYKFCPYCGKAIAEPEAPREVPYRYSLQETINWPVIQSWSEAGTAAEHLEVGDEISDTLKNGEEITLVVVDTNVYTTGDVVFGLKDCLKTTYPMNTTATNEGGWNRSHLRQILNTEILDLLPDDLRACIKPRTINGEESALWLFSEREIFGDQEWVESDSDCGTQLQYFKRPANRVKGLGPDGSAYYWWERSPNSSNSTSFCFVYNSGGANINYASYSLGVAFGFCV